MTGVVLVTGAAGRIGVLPDPLDGAEVFAEEILRGGRPGWAGDDVPALVGGESWQREPLG